MYVNVLLDTLSTKVGLCHKNMLINLLKSLRAFANIYVYFYAQIVVIEGTTEG